MVLAKMNSFDRYKAIFNTQKMQVKLLIKARISPFPTFFVLIILSFTKKVVFLHILYTHARIK